MKTQLPAGLVDNNTEIFTHDNRLKYLSSGAVNVNLSKEGRSILIIFLLENKEKVDKLILLGFTGEALINKLTSCLFGGFDNIPDINLEDKTLNPEYWDCPQRSTCSGSGVICILPSGPGGKLSHRQIDAIKAIQDGAPMKLASERIGVQFNTFRAYIKSAYKRAGVHSNVELLQFAHNNNIV